VHPFQTEDDKDAPLYWCCEEGCDDVFVPPPAGYFEEKTHGGLVLTKAPDVHPGPGAQCPFCSHPILAHTDLARDWEHGCAALHDRLPSCMCSGHVECVACRRVVEKPFFKPEKCEGCGRTEFENA
jgi:hypothetical protein